MSLFIYTRIFNCIDQLQGSSAIERLGTDIAVIFGLGGDLLVDVLGNLLQPLFEARLLKRSACSRESNPTPNS